jgi:hypothetical protein
MDKNMDELATLIEKNADRRDKSVTELILLHNEQVRFRTGCREEILKELNVLKTTVATEARLAAKTESKKWGLIIVLISTLMGAAVGVIVTVLTHGAY